MGWQLAALATQADLGHPARVQLRRFRFKNFSDHPHAAQIGDAVKLHHGVEMLSGGNIAGQNKSVSRGDHINALGQLAAIGDLSDLLVAHSEIAQAISISLNTLYPFSGNLAPEVRRKPCSVLAHGA